MLAHTTVQPAIGSSPTGAALSSTFSIPRHTYLHMTALLVKGHSLVKRLFNSTAATQRIMSSYVISWKLPTVPLGSTVIKQRIMASPTNQRYFSTFAQCPHEQVADPLLCNSTKGHSSTEAALVSPCRDPRGRAYFSIATLGEG